MLRRGRPAYKVGVRAWSLVITLGLVFAGLPGRALAGPAGAAKKDPPSAGAAKRDPGPVDAAKPVSPAADGAASPGAAGAPAPASTPPAPASATLVLPGDLAQPVTVLDGQGRAVATVAPNTGHGVAVSLPPGTYSLRGPEGPIGEPLTLDAGAPTEAAIPATLRTPAAAGSPAPQPVAAPDTSSEDSEPTSGEEPPAPTKPKLLPWKPYVAPVLSALVPGTGQMLNGQVGKGLGVMLSTAAFIVGAVTLARAGDPTEGAGGRADDRRSIMQEVSSQVGFAAFTGALGFLYVAQIADAHNSAAHRKPTPRKRYRMRVELARMSTVSARPGQPSHGLLNDWNVSFMGQPVKRLSVGLSDVAIARNRRDDRTVFQGGLRLGYRVFDRRRFWIQLALGTLLQGAILGDTVTTDRATHFGAAVYGQLGLRYFVFDWMSLGVIPRLSVPLTTRVYAYGGSIPRYAPTLELGLAWGVHF